MEQWEMELREQLLDDRRPLSDEDEGADDNYCLSRYQMLERLEQVADVLGDAGIIVNTPAGKLRWIEQGI